VKTAVAVLAIPFLLSISGLAQMTLNPGESYSHRFTSLPFNVVIGAAESSGGYNVGFASFQPGSTVRLEMWEGEMIGPPIKSILTNVSGAVSCSSTGAWNDLEGSLRFTLVTGFGTIANVQVWSLMNAGAPTSYAFHSQTLSPLFVPPQLSIVSRTNLVELSWWSNGYAGYVLEWTNNIPGASWTSVTQAPALVAGRNRVTLSSTGQTKQFFRLRK